MTNHDTHKIAPNHKSAISFPTLEIDYKLFEDELKDSSLTDNQKREYLQIVWSFVVGCVDLGFDIHPVQQACEQKLVSDKFLTSSFKNVVNSNHPKAKASKPSIEFPAL
ncbi:MAG: hypothetical protein COC24_002060 [Alphaproteobacteria bacterium]|nr:hypothetical protein [Alphaproteobacteria bacterium]